MISEKVLRDSESCTRFTLNYDLIENLLNWLEKDDSDLEKVIGYSICLMVVTYFLARTLQALL